MIATLLTGCTAQVNSVDALKMYSDKFGECQRLLHSNVDIPPPNLWFEALSNEDKLNVLGYLFQRNNKNCIEKETHIIYKSFTNDGNEEILDLFISDLPAMESMAKKRVSHLNQTELNKLQESYNKPFDLREVAKTLNLLN
ncbi:hypothetical protein C9I89_06545 [Photobacterium lipolyticum]|uniref:Uncharacterized protein n=2 Tax=Photobacterium lipolyticum TaxID=266810 RepID=A0A2T3N1J3_9GAMM|nr:hypothetical protein C9I89_06545 [Photobacterium lipolyticum]